MRRSAMRCPTLAERSLCDSRGLFFARGKLDGSGLVLEFRGTYDSAGLGIDKFACFYTVEEEAEGTGRGDSELTKVYILEGAKVSSKKCHRLIYLGWEWSERCESKAGLERRK